MGMELFWISGKPGSGKSTFMKFIVHNRQTDHALQVWAGDKDVLKASHYFWAAGATLQKSHEGLLRSLLFDILDQYPQLIPAVLPGRWSLTDQLDQTAPSDLNPWTLTELQASIRALGDKTDAIARFCFFIDGLDEYFGDCSYLCQVVKDLSKCPGIKVCLSSRPWNIFEENFGAAFGRKIYVHDLTQQDIRYYAETRLCEHPRWSSVVTGTRKTAALLNEITQRAKGVFLWVFLVTKLLRDGMTNYDTMADLWKRLDAIPEDLEQFFKHILSSVEPFYHEKMAGTLQIALTASRPLELILYTFHDLEYEDEQYSRNESLENWDIGKATAFTEPFQWRLSSRCMGLLEITNDKVDFLHRTVSDFLRTAKMAEFIASHLRPSFEPNFSIFQAYISWMKHMGHCLDLVTIITEALGYARDAFDSKRIDHDVISDHVDELEWCFGTVSDTRRKDQGLPYMSTAFGPMGRAVHGTDFPASLKREQFYNSIFRRAVLRADFVEYASRKLLVDPLHFEGLPPVAFLVALDLSANKPDPDGSSVEGWTPKRLSLLRCLLRNGCDPNKVCDDIQSSPWADFLKKLAVVRGRPTLSLHQLRLISAITQGIFSMFLEFGADPNPLSANDYIEPWIDVMLSGLHSASCRHLTGHVDVYIRVLDRMLEHANFDRVFDFTEKSIWNFADKTSSCRVDLWNIVVVRVHKLTEQVQNVSTDEPPPRHQDLHLLAEIIRIFVTRAAHPSLQVEGVARDLKILLPPSLQMQVFEAIRTCKVTMGVAQSNPQVGITETWTLALPIRGSPPMAGRGRSRNGYQRRGGGEIDNENLSQENNHHRSQHQALGRGRGERGDGSRGRGRGKGKGRGKGRGGGRGRGKVGES